jgi:soluble lytic murein transglycosylase-like protein
MKLFVTAISVPVLVLSGVAASASYRIYAGSARFTNPPPPKLPVTYKIAAPAYALNDVVRVLAHKHGVKPGIVSSIIAAESAYDQTAVSERGAVGLMQLMPDTAREYGVDPNIAEQNIEGGTRYLGSLLHRYRHCRNPLQRSIAAYNSGPGSVDRYRGVPPFRETRRYVKRVMTLYRTFESNRGKTWKTARVSGMPRVEDAD